MEKKKSIRRRIFLKRKLNYFEIKKNFFVPLIKIIKKTGNIKKKCNIALYYPNSYELNIFKIFENEYFYKFNFLLPIIEKNNSMNFYRWKKDDILFLNKFGIPEPIKTKKIKPDIILVPLLAFDNMRNRLGYGKGFYDKYLNKYMKLKKRILTIGIAFYFQKYNSLPFNNKDYKLDYIITENGILWKF